MVNNPRLARLIDLVPFISVNQGISISELATKFGVSSAEIEKDLWLLYMCGLPGQTPLELMEFEFEDGYVTVRNADELKHPRSLTQTEIATLVIGLEILQSRGSEAAENLKQRLIAMLKTKVDFQPTAAEKFLPEITKAIQGNFVLKINYSGKSREVIPFQTYQDGSDLYLRAFCKIANDWRTFKISKIQELELTERNEMIPNLVPTSVNLITTRIRVHHSARRVRELLGGVDEIQVYSVDWLISQVIALAGAVELLDPEMRSVLRARVVASQNQYL